MNQKTNVILFLVFYLFSSCAMVKDLPQYHFADGLYRTSSLGAKK